MKIETHEIIEMLKPYRNGCSINAYVVGQDIYLGYGCYCLVNLVNGAKKIIVDKLEYEHPGEKVKLTQDLLVDDLRHVKLEIVKMTDTCERCNGPIFIKCMRTEYKGP